MRKRQYLVRVNKDPNSDWGASVPDLPGCVATGKTIDITLRRIERAVTLHLRGLREDGINPPIHDTAPLLQDARSDRWIFTRLSRWLPNPSPSDRSLTRRLSFALKGPV